MARPAAVVAEHFVGLDADVQEYIAAAVVDEENAVLERSELVDLVAPLLEELVGGDEAQAVARAEGLYDALMRPPSSQQQAAAAPSAGEPPPLSAGPATAAAAPPPPGAPAGRAAPRPEPSPGLGTSGARAALSEEEVATAAANALAAFGLDADVVEFVGAVAAEDPWECTTPLDDALEPVLQGLGVPVAEACEALRQALRAPASRAEDKSEASNAEPTEPAAAAAAEPTRRRPIRMGSVDDPKARLDVAAVGLRQLALDERRSAAAEEMRKRADANEVAAERKRERKEARERERARQAVERAELANEALLAVDAAPQRGAGKAGARDIVLHSFSLPNPAGGPDLLEKAALTLMHGRRYGLCGKNGSGKSTMLRLLAAGRVSGLPPDLHIMHVSQDSAEQLTNGRESPLEVVLAGDTRRAGLLRERDRLEAKGEAAADELAAVYGELDEIGAHSAPERAREMLKGLQFTPTAMDAPVSTLSGGWRVRVSLARALFVAPEVLFLDEPTNHLDLEAVSWLENRLVSWGERTLVVVSHDRAFLNAVSTDIIHLARNTLTAFQGDFATFEATRAEERKRQQRLYEQQEAKKAEMQRFVDKHTHKGSSLVKDDAAAAQAKKVAKQMEKMGALGHDGKRYKASRDGPQVAVEAPEEDEAAHKLTFPEPALAHGSGDLVQLRDVTFSYTPGGKALFRDVQFPVGPTARIALVGPNGAGKSTLLKLVVGTLEPTSGEVVRAHNARCAMFTQHHVDQLDLSLSAVEYLMQRDPQCPREDVRRRLGHFGVSGSRQLQRMGLLSGGQRSRVAFCVATWTRPSLLLLDEPTNHLDLETSDHLAEACARFQGAIIAISHDVHFLATLEAELWLVEGDANPGVKRWEGGLKAYKARVLKSLGL